METTTTTKRIKDVVIVLELTEQPTSPVFPVPGADGGEIGLMTFDPVRGRHCLRMPLDVFRRHKENLFTARRRFFQIIPDIEFVYEDEGEDSASLVTTLEDRIVDLESKLAKAKGPRKRKAA
jgi:hypothetical protein